MSEYVDGGLGFRAELNIDDFNISADAMERRMKKVSNAAVYESERMDQSLLSFAQNGAKYIATYLIGNGLSNLLNSIVQVRGQFQQLDIAFETMLGSATKSNALMNQLLETAAKTPFDLTGIASGAKQLLAYGTAADKVNETLVRLGNIASGLSIPLNDIVYLYGTTQVQGRLYAQDVRQFTIRGIPLVRELAEMYGKNTEEITAMVSAGKIGFADVEKVILKMTNSGGQFFNLMEKQSKSLTGMIANFGDAWQVAQNKFGEDNQDLFAAGIEGATYMVEHLDDILRILKAIAIAYGTYKAAIIANTIVTKGYTGIALIDNTVRQAKIALMKAETILSGEETAIKKKMAQAEKDHVKALREKITIEQHDQALNKIRIDTINELLTAEQRRYLSNKRLTSSSKEYVKEAESILDANQKMALENKDLSTSGMRYADAISEMAKENERNTKFLQNKLTEIKKSIPILEQNKKRALESVEIARLDNITIQAGTNERRKLASAHRLEAQELRYNTIVTELSTATKRKETIETKLAANASQQSAAAITIDDIAKKTATKSTNLFTIATSKLSMAIKVLWASMKANPVGWVVSAIGVAISAFTVFKRKQEDAEKELTGLAKASKKASDEFDSQASKIDRLTKVINNANASYKDKNKAITDLKKIIPGYNAMLDNEGTLIRENKVAIDEYLKALERQIKLKAAQEELEEVYRQKRIDERAAMEKVEKGKNGVTYQGGSPTLGGVQYNYINDAYSEAEKQEIMRKASDKTSKTIKELTDEINKTSLSIEESSKSARTYTQQISDTEAQIKSLKSELKELRSGSVVNDNLANVIEEKTKDLKEAEERLATLTGVKKSSEPGSESLNQKILDNQLKLEQARINIMEEGYEKRKAVLNLQHKRNLAEIDKEEKELQKVRREAGKSGLSDKEQSAFADRRKLEDQSYSKEQNKLFDGEIDYKKKQYELYFRWVKNMGEDVANTQFSSLLKGGASYKDYVEKQIQELTNKKNAGSLSEGEGNHLIALNIQYDEITGAKTAMDTFKESMSQAINRATTLAEKIQAIADAKEKLDNGKSGLVGADEKAEASLYISQADKEADDELQAEVLKSYRTYEQQKKAIQDEYALLRNEAIKQGNDEALKEINKGENLALSRLNAEMLMQTDEWENLFNNLDSLTASQISNLVNKINSKMSELNLTMDPADLKAILDRLQEANQKVVEKNPFIALSNSYAQMTEANKELDAAKKKGLSEKELDKFEKAAILAAQNTANAINGITSMLDEVGASLSNLAGAFGEDELAEDISFATDMISGLGTTAGGVAKLMAGDISGIKDVVTGLADTIASIVNQKDKKIERKIQGMQIEVKKLENAYERLGRAIDKTYNNNVYKLMDDQEENLKKQKELIKQQIAAEESKKKTDKEKISEWQNQMVEIDNQIEDTKQKQIEMLAGTDVQSAIDEFADAIVDAYAKGGDAAKAMGETTKKILANAVKEALKKKFLADGIEQTVNQLATDMEDGNLSDREQSNFEKSVDTAGQKFKKSLEAYDKLFKDFDPEEVNEDPLTGAVRREISEETGSIVAGKLNAIGINQADGLDLMRQALIYHQQTAANTGVSASELKEIRVTLKRIENKGSSLLSQGLE